MFGYNNYYQPPMPDNLQMYRNQQYQQPIQQPQMAQISQNQPTQQNGERIWVQGLEGAKAYMIIPGAEAVLWDSEKPYIYIKTADLQGRPNLQILSYSKSEQADKSPKVPDLSNDFVTKKEFEDFKKQFEIKAPEKENEEK